MKKYSVVVLKYSSTGGYKRTGQTIKTGLTQDQAIDEARAFNKMQNRAPAPSERGFSLQEGDLYAVVETESGQGDEGDIQILISDPATPANISEWLTELLQLRREMSILKG